MAFHFTLPFYAFKLHLRPGLHVLIPMTDKEAARLTQPIHLVAGQYAEELQRKVLNRGHISALLDEYRPGEFIRDQLRIPFPAAGDGISFPDFELEFDFFFSQQSQGYWGIVPVLGIEGYSRQYNDLLKKLVDAVRLDFGRHRRLTAVQEIVSTIWYESVELLHHRMELQGLGPKELDDLIDQPQELLLPKVAQKVEMSRPAAYGRRAELEQLSRALKNDFSRNVLLVGPSGSGKTALVWEISRQFADRNLKGQIWETTASTLIKELTRDTGWQDNLAFLCQELARTDDLLFVRNLMDLFEVGKYEGNEMAIADYLRTYLSRGEISLISECTEEEMAVIDLKSPNYLSFFQIVRLEEPGEELEQIILKKVNALAEASRTSISEEAIREVIRLNRRFTPYSGMPGKPIRFLESMLISRPEARGDRKPGMISRSEVIQHFCEDSGMPAFMIDPSIPMDITGVRTFFNAAVFGQEDAVDALAKLLASVKTALTRTGKPIASLLFVGPTGVGKTELAKVLAQFMFGSRDRLTRFDMSEFSSPYTVLRLIGTSYFSEGLLTSAVRREPFSVLLFDEIEKADPSFYDLLLQILSEGRLTDSQGKLVNFCSTIIIMTSNIGTEKLPGQSISWKREKADAEVKDHYLSAVQHHFRPELFNRIDQVIAFEPLDRLTVRYVVEREIEQFRQREGIKFKRLQMEIEDEVLDYLGEQGYSGQYGARHLQRSIREELILPLARALNAQDPEDQLVARAILEGGKPSLEVIGDPLSVELLLEEWNKIEQADQASALRRQINRLKEGPYFIQLSNELERLEGKKNRRKKKFWEDHLEGGLYTAFLETRKRLEKLQKEVEEMEMNLSLASLGFGPYHTQLIGQMKGWEKNFFQLKVELYARLNPKSDVCFIGIYGKNAHRSILNYYIRLLELRHFEFEAKALWFRESYYNEWIQMPSGPAREGEHTGRKRAEYIKVALEPGQLSPPRDGDVLFGVEIAVRGPGALLYFSEEAGAQRWQIEEKKARIFWVDIQHGTPVTPENIHRKDFYRALSPRRTIESESIKDSLYGINREVKHQNLAVFMATHSDKKFQVKLNMELF